MGSEGLVGLNGHLLHLGSKGFAMRRSLARPMRSIPTGLTAVFAVAFGSDLLIEDTAPPGVVKGGNANRLELRIFLEVLYSGEKILFDANQNSMIPQ